MTSITGCFKQTVATLNLIKIAATVKKLHEVRRGAQGPSRVATGKSGVYACDEEEPINALESW